MSSVDYIEENNFDTVLAENTVVMADFTAKWCGPCRTINPIMDKLAENYDGKMRVIKIDVDQSKSIAKKFGITSIPVVMIFKGGELVETFEGVKTFETFLVLTDSGVSQELPSLRPFMDMLMDKLFSQFS